MDKTMGQICWKPFTDNDTSFTKKHSDRLKFRQELQILRYLSQQSRSSDYVCLPSYSYPTFAVFVFPRYKTDLFEFICFESCSVDILFDILHKVTLAMEFLHNHHIDHYDIKPENVILNDIHHVRLIDFDCSRQDQEGYTPLLGTVRYMAPEVSLYPESPYSPNSMDVFSFGCMVLYSLYPDTFHFFPNTLWKPIHYDALLYICRYKYIPVRLRVFLTHCFLFNPTDRLSIPSFRSEFQELCKDQGYI